MPHLHRAQLLLEDRQHRELSQIAESEGTSLSGLVRQIIDCYLAKKQAQERRDRESSALAELTQLRKRLCEEHGTYAGDPVAASRREREEQTDTVWRAT